MKGNKGHTLASSMDSEDRTILMEGIIAELIEKKDR